MKKIWILSLLAVSVLAVLGAVLLLNTSKTEASATGDAVIKMIMSRQSVRSYTSQRVDSEQVEVLLRAAMAAPSAVNKQPWAFVVVDDRELLDTLAAVLPYAKMLAQAPLAIVVCGDTSKALLAPDQSYWVQDCSAATENLLLAAHSLGLGAVWTGVFPREERVQAVRRVLRIPGQLIPLNVIPVGYPQENGGEPKDKWDPAKIHYNQF